MVRSTNVAGGAVALLALTACGVTPNDDYRDVGQLQSALNGEGFRCSGDDTNSIADGYGEELECDEGMRIAVWESDLPEYANDSRSAAFSISMMTNEDVLVSDTWLISSRNTDLIREIVEVFGGDYYGTDEDLQCAHNPNASC